MNLLLCSYGKISTCQLNPLERSHVPWRARFLLFIISDIVRCTVRLETCIKLTVNATFGAQLCMVLKLGHFGK
jgi:hypothetical protein